MTENQLQPCPFCGGSTLCQFFEPAGLGDYEPEYHFVCDGCDVLVIMVDVTTESNAIAIYNTRAGEVA